MVSRRRKDNRQVLLRSIAILLSFLYLLQPFGKEVGELLHQMSHFLEPPSSLLKHHYFDDDLKIHELGEHGEFTSDHEHSIINLVSAFLDQPFSNEPSTKSGVLKIKVDKHLTSEYVTKEDFHSLCKGTLGSTLQKKPLNGHPFDNYRPPQI